jgi:hypothetical protein
MKKYVDLFQSIVSDKDSIKSGLLISLVICLLMIGRMSVSMPIKSEFCKKEILKNDSLKVENNDLKTVIAELEDQISKIQKDRYKKEVEIVDLERKECNIKIAKKIKSIKKVYLQAKCKICNK